MSANFDWGWLSENTPFSLYHRATIMDEIFVRETYESHLQVEPGDIVLDVGASVGPFTHSIRKKGAAKVFCFEPSEKLFETLRQNVESENVVCLNYGMADIDGESPDLYHVFTDKQREFYPTIRFKTFLEKYGIDHIDFLKTDCEGGEYAIFNEENIDWILANVRKIVGEWHLDTPEMVDKFVKFRFRYLERFKKFTIEDVAGLEITEDFLEHFDESLLFFKQIIIHIDNRK